MDDPSRRIGEDGKIAQYDEEDQEAEEMPVQMKGRKLKIIIAKQRNGSTGAFNMLFVSDYVCFRDIEKF